ncbi:MAG: ABC transporter substrate-binding protein [Acidocella sp. 20-63-7]|nr:MAG: ABC transporter substrate-binding protein [Acidocella sp. 20-63-7]
MSEQDSTQAGVGRRALLTSGAALGAAGLLAPATSWAQNAQPIKIGHIDSMTGNFAVLGESQIMGAQFAAAELNAKGGILGRPVQVLPEDDAGSPATGLDKAARLFDQDKVDFFTGTTSSAVSLAISQYAQAHSRVFVCSGGHVDKLTGSACNWATFRVCSTTWMMTYGDSKTMLDKFGKKWYFLTTDYAFGHSEQADYTKQVKDLGGTIVGGALVPVGTSDFSSYLIQVKAAAPDVLCLLLAGDDQINAMKQITQFGINKSIAVGGALFELEQIAALPEAARYGVWTFEWYWDQPGVPHVADFVKRFAAANGGKYPSARAWFGYASVHSLALACEKAGSTDSVKVAKAMEGLVLPPEIALQPGAPVFRPEDHQLMLGMFPGSVNQKGTYPHLMNVFGYVPGASIAQSPAETGCKLTYPA